MLVFRSGCVLAFLLMLSACGTRKNTAPLPPTPEEAVGTPASVEAQCQIMRRITLFESGREFYLINVCPSDAQLANLDLALNIALPGEQPVTTYFDTMRSFPDEERARQYARENGLFDIFFEQAAGSY
jgi:hypothetical protein